MADAHVIRHNFGSRPLLVDTDDRPRDKHRLLTPTERAYHDAFGSAQGAMNCLDMAGSLAVDPTTAEPAREGRRARAVASAQEAIEGLQTIIGLLAQHPTEPETA